MPKTYPMTKCGALYAQKILCPFKPKFTARSYFLQYNGGRGAEGGGGGARGGRGDSVLRSEKI